LNICLFDLENLLAMLQVKDVNVLARNRFILKSVSFNVSAKSLVCIVGLSGVGKSTLLQIMTGAITPSCGSVEYDDQQVSSFGRIFLSAKLPLCSTETVREWLTHSRRSRPGTALQTETEVSTIMLKMGISHCESAYVNGTSGCTRLSSGELKRIAICNALLLEPSVLLVDELTSGLSEADVLQVMPVLQAYVKDELIGADKSLVCTIHQGSTKCMAFFDQVIVLAEGGVVFDGQMKDVHAYFSNLMRSEVLPVDSFDTAVDWALWHLADGKHPIQSAKWDIAELVLKAREARFFDNMHDVAVADQSNWRQQRCHVSAWRQFDLCFTRLWRAQVRGIRSIFCVTLGLGSLLLACFILINARITEREDVSKAFGELNVIYVSTFMISTAVRLHVPVLTAMQASFKVDIRQRMYTPSILVVACVACWMIQWLIISVAVQLIMSIVLKPRSFSEAAVSIMFLFVEVLIHATILDTVVWSGMRRRYVDACMVLFDTMCWMSAGNVSGYTGMTVFGQMLYNISPTALTFAGMIRNRFGEDTFAVSLFLDLRPEPALYFLSQLCVYLLCLRIISTMIICMNIRQPDRTCQAVSGDTLESMHTDYLFGNHHGDHKSCVIQEERSLLSTRAGGD
jgi:ABC-type multidrug transport system ATPase subunit